MNEQRESTSVAPRSG